MTTAIEQATRTRVEIHYDEHRGDWTKEADHLGMLIEHVERGPSIHEQLRDVSVAVRVDAPRSYVDQSSRPAVLYVTPEKMREEYGADNAETRATARKCLEAEARDYRAYMDGSTYGYVLTVEKRCESCGTWSAVETELDSVWGFTTDEPERDLLDWMGEYMDERGRAALADALANWTGEYPVAARGVA